MITTTLAAILLIFLPHGGHGYSGQSMQITLTPTVQTQREHWQIHWRLTRGPLELARGEHTTDGADGVDGADGADGPRTTVTLQLPVVRSVTKLQWQYTLYSPDADAPATLKLRDQGLADLWIHPPANLPWAGAFAQHNTLTVLGKPDRSRLAEWLTDLGFKVRVAQANDVMAIQQAQWLVVEEGVHDTRAMQAIYDTCERGARLLMIGSPSLSTPWITTMNSIDVVRPTTEATLKTTHPLLANFEETWLQTWVNEKPTAVARRTDVSSGGTSVVGWLHPQTQSLEAEAAMESHSENRELRMLDTLVWAQRIGSGQAVFWRLDVTDWREDPRALLMLNNMMLYLMNPPPPMLDRTASAVSKETP